MTASDRGTASGMSESTASAMVGASGVATPAGVAPDRFFKYWLIVAGDLPAAAGRAVPADLFAGGQLPEPRPCWRWITSFAGLHQLRQPVQGCAAVGGAAPHRRSSRSIALPHRTGARPADGAAVPGADARPADLRIAAGAADHHLADRRRRHLAAAVRQPLRSDQPDHRLVRGRADDRCCGPSIRTWSIRRSCCARSGSGRRSCS